MLKSQEDFYKKNLPTFSLANYLYSRTLVMLRLK